MASSSSAVASLKEACLLVAMCAMLLHSSVGQQPPTEPASPTSPYTGQQPPSSPPAPPSPEVPSPMPTPTPAPAPSPTTAATPCIIYTYDSDCGSQCGPSCQASYKPRNCSNMVESAFDWCYESCTNHTCPGKSCVHSGCGYATCSCSNKYARSCCESCRASVFPAVGSAYQQCQSYNDRFMGYCMMYCNDGCMVPKNCTAA